MDSYEGENFGVRSVDVLLTCTLFPRFQPHQGNAHNNTSGSMKSARSISELAHKELGGLSVRE